MKKLMILMILTAPLSARYHRITNAQDFEKLVNQYTYSVVCFAPDAKLQEEQISSDDVKDRKKTFKELKDMLQSAASKFEFKHFLSKDVGFIIADVSAKRAQDLIKDYRVTQTPVCYVFQEGAIDKASRALNPTSTKDIIDLLEDSAGSNLQNILDERKEEQDQDRQERIARYYAYGGFYPYAWGYGWGGSSYWARPYWGWGTAW